VTYEDKSMVAGGVHNVVRIDPYGNNGWLFGEWGDYTGAFGSPGNGPACDDGAGEG